MSGYKDYGFSVNAYGKCQEYTDKDAIILAIRNILLSKPGNYPMHPSIGMNIKKYKFEFLDDDTVKSIQSELNRAIADNIPDLKGISAVVKKVESEDGLPYLCIALYDSETALDSSASFIINSNCDIVNVFNEEN